MSRWSDFTEYNLLNLGMIGAMSKEACVDCSHAYSLPGSETPGSTFTCYYVVGQCTPYSEQVCSGHTEIASGVVGF